MAYSPIKNITQYMVAGESASGYVLKAYTAGTTTAIQMATDSGGGTLVNTVSLNAEGYPEVSGNIVQPHINETYKLSLYPDQASADADSGAVWTIDNLTTTGLSASIVDSVDTLTDLRNYTGESTTVILEGGSASADGDGGIYIYKSGQAPSTYTDDGVSTIVPTGGDGSAAYLKVETGYANLGDGVLQRPEIKDYSETLQAHGNTGTTETIDLENGNIHSITLDDNCTLTFSNPPATGKGGSFTLIVTQDGTGSRTITWPGSVVWDNGVAPTLSTGAADVDIFTFVTINAGTTWYGFTGGLNFA